MFYAILINNISIYINQFIQFSFLHINSAIYYLWLLTMITNFTFPNFVVIISSFSHSPLLTRHLRFPLWLSFIFFGHILYRHSFAPISYHFQTPPVIQFFLNSHRTCVFLFSWKLSLDFGTMFFFNISIERKYLI